MQYWNNPNLIFNKVSSLDDAYLNIEFIDPDRMANPKWIAQYSKKIKSIQLNYAHSDILKGKRISAAVAHEFGHVIGLEHTRQINSIMNEKIPSDAQPSIHDLNRMNKKLPLFYYKMKLQNSLNNLI